MKEVTKSNKNEFKIKKEMNECLKEICMLHIS